MSQSSGATRRLAEWIVGGVGEPSLRALELAQVSVIDTIACGLAGTSEPGPWALARTRRAEAGLPGSLWGMGGGYLPRDAALLNGMLAHMLDFDDGDMVSRMHPSCMLVPALFAAADEKRFSGREILEAYLTGYYVIQAVGRVCGRKMAERGWHVTGIIGVLGATASLARLHRLSADQAANALGLAASTAGGVRGNFGTDMKPYHAGRAAGSAVEAIELTLAGVTASHDILEAKDGLIWTFADPDLAPNIGAEVDSLVAGNYSIEKEPPNIKLYACCHATHAPIAAALELRSDLLKSGSDIREVVVEAPHMSALYLTFPRPTNGLEGKFSMEASIAVALIDGEAGVDQFTDQSIMRDEVQAFLPKVRTEYTDRMEEIHRQFKMPGKVTIVTDSGTVSREVQDARGCRSDPCNVDDVLGKFRTSADGVLDADAAAEAAERLSRFDNEKDISTLAVLLRGSDRSQVSDADTSSARREEAVSVG